MPLLTIAYLTFRYHPRFEWFVTSLEREMRNALIGYDDVQVIAVDGKHGVRALQAPFPVQHVPPKPTVWQGQHRLTTRDYFCAANARNTAFALARAEHVAFVDDLSILLPGWLKAHLQAAREGYVLAGSTCKRKNIELSDAGYVTRADDFPPGTDSRWKQIHPDSSSIPVPCSGSWLYGGTFSVPLSAALIVNGQDEIHDTIGGEDYDFGMRLERAGAAIKYLRESGTIEDEDGHHTETPMIRLDKPWPPTNARQPRTVLHGGWSAPAAPAPDDGPYSSNFLYKKLLRDAGRVWTVGNAYDLLALRESVLAGEPFPVPTEPSTHWVDGQPLSEM